MKKLAAASGGSGVPCQGWHITDGPPRLTRALHHLLFVLVEHVQLAIRIVLRSLRNPRIQNPVSLCPVVNVAVVAPSRRGLVSREVAVSDVPLL